LRGPLPPVVHELLVGRGVWGTNAGRGLVGALFFPAWDRGGVSVPDRGALEGRIGLLLFLLYYE
jgi:hypothetical protein